MFQEMVRQPLLKKIEVYPSKKVGSISSPKNFTPLVQSIFTFLASNIPNGGIVLPVVHVNTNHNSYLCFVA